MNAMREKFEAWIASQCRKNGASDDYITSILRRGSDGFYMYAGLDTRFSDFCEVWELSAASQAQQTDSQWISVEERLPETSDKELIVRLKPRRKNQKKTECRIAIYDKPCEWEDPVFWCVVREVDIEVESWMPLPPEGGDK